MIEHRIEPGVGGRFLEVYENGALELGRITVWEPPQQLSWTSSVDDVRIDVTFEVLSHGSTRVHVVGTAGSAEAGQGLAVVRMTPQWLPRYFTRRATSRDRPSLGPLHIVLRYHLAHAEESGAMIVSSIVQHGYRSYTAADRDGRHWIVARAPPLTGRDG